MPALSAASCPGCIDDAVEIAIQIIGEQQA